MIQVLYLFHNTHTHEKYVVLVGESNKPASEFCKPGFELAGVLEVGGDLSFWPLGVPMTVTQ